MRGIANIDKWEKELFNSDQNKYTCIELGSDLNFTKSEGGSRTAPTGYLFECNHVL